MSDEVVTRDTSSGRVHRRTQMGGLLLTYEGCNLDDAGDFEVLTAAELADAEDLCHYCFPPIGQDDQAG